ncbi:baculoviral IAP repeat-containing protein 7-B-like [Ostrea edulis]|uniref:baculoviral IAP repeat-containing protein 7-B-like n=1 Tax=Ostrea edulis TaxID=37623 RepID=UPI0024AED3C5|nr:baculoviral IAP repeat-containing protein 7-B-like [Ostrea edulis]
MTDYESLHNPGTPRYALLSDRVASFENAPEHLQNLLPTIAEAGYFYKGYGDNTCCFYCNFGLHHWGAVDNPWIQHAYWYPHCPYLKCNKGKQWLKHEFTMVVAGPSKLGKTEFVKQLVQNTQWIAPPPEKIVWCYREWQSAYESLQDKVTFIRNIPQDDEQIVADLTYEDATRVPHGYLLVDLSPQTSDDLRLRSQLFTNLAVHMPPRV